MAVQQRIYRAEADLRAVADLLARAWTRSGPFTLWHIGDVCWWERRDRDRNALLWEDESRDVVGFEDSDRHGYYGLALPPGWVGGAEHLQMVMELEARPREPFPTAFGPA